MSKGLKGLEALKRIKNDMIYQLQIKGECIVNDDFHTIEIALERLEQLEEDFMSLTEANMELVHEQAENQKKLKALEIIKAIGVINVYEDVGGKYHLETMVDNVGLTKEEYKLLQEVFYETNK